VHEATADFEAGADALETRRFHAGRRR
jgi:hypothetical protein